MIGVSRLRGGWALAWMLVVGAFMLLLAIPPVTLPADSAGLRRFLVPLNGETAVAQTFAMTADGLHIVELAPQATGPVASGTIRFELTEQGSGVVRQGELPAESLLSSSFHGVEFAPIGDSKDSIYRLELMSSETDPVHGIGLAATKGHRYPDGAMQINGRERWADLAFRAVAPAGRSTWSRLMAMESPPPGVSRRGAILTALTLYLIAAGFVLRTFWHWHP